MSGRGGNIVEISKPGKAWRADRVETQKMRKKKQIMHYSNRDVILLVGEGDFSFAKCLANAFGSAANMVATSLDSEEELHFKHPQAVQNVEELEDLGCLVLHRVDAKTMNNHPILRLNKFDKIVYNFPHAGFFGREDNHFQIQLHQDLVKGFLRRAKSMLKPNGEIHITHKTSYPFNKWEIEQLAEDEGLILLEEVGFCRSNYPGYVNKKGDGPNRNRSFPVGECSTFKFVRG